jgi:hypothetical protein
MWVAFCFSTYYLVAYDEWAPWLVWVAFVLACCFTGYKVWHHLNLDEDQHK